MKLVSYHSNLYFDSFVQHVAEIKSKGFDTILFCISETDMLYNMKILQEFRVYAESEGLKTWATFWGLTAGESVVTNVTPHSINTWITKVLAAGFKDVMIDEPKDNFTIKTFLYFWHKLNFHLCLSDDTFNRMSDEEIKNFDVKSLGVSNYHWVKDWDKIKTRSEAIAKRLHALRPNDNFVFVQGFDIPDGWETIPIVVKGICEANGIENFGFWSFKATAATGTKRPVNHKQIWDSINF